METMIECWAVQILTSVDRSRFSWEIQLINCRLLMEEIQL